jgi:hypothetical protein
LVGKPAPVSLWELACLGRAFIAAFLKDRVKGFAGKPAPTVFAQLRKLGTGAAFVGAGLPAKAVMQATMMLNVTR